MYKITENNVFKMYTKIDNGLLEKIMLVLTNKIVLCKKCVGYKSGGENEGWI